MHMTEDTVESVCRYNDFGERGTEWGGETLLMIFPDAGHTP